jgi:hypothetical protein
MKHSYLFLSLILLISSTSLIAQASIEHVFRKYKNDEGVLNLNFTGEILKMINNSKANLKSKVDNVDIIVFQDKNDVNVADKAKIQNLLDKDKFDLLVDVKNKNQKVRLYAVESGSFLNKVFAHINSPELNAYFILTGKIVFEELAKLGMDFQNSENLKILESLKNSK